MAKTKLDKYGKPKQRYETRKVQEKTGGHTREERMEIRNVKANAVGRAKKWAQYIKKDIAILDLAIVVKTTGKTRNMAPAERTRIPDVMHGQPFNKDGTIMAISSKASMKMPLKDLPPDHPDAIKFPGDPLGGANKPAKAEVEEEGGEPVVDNRKPPERPRDAVIGSDDMVGPNPLIAQLINAGYPEDEARAIATKKKIEKPRPGVDVPATNPDKDPGPSQGYDPEERPDIVLVDGVGFKLKHYHWLQGRIKETGLSFQDCIDQIVAAAFARDPMRHSVRTRSGGFSGRREDLKDAINKP